MTLTVKKRIKDIITAVLFLAMIFGFLIITLIRKTGDESYRENRRLAQLPEMSIESLSEGAFTKQLGDFFTDRFAGRSYWLTAKGYTNIIIGESIINDVFAAEDMLLSADTCRDISCSGVADNINSYAEDYDGAVYFVAVPTSAGVYSDRLPEYLTACTEKESIDSLYSLISENVRKIDAYNILKMLNDNYIYYRNDSKWTSYGAYCVYRTVIQKLGFLPVSYDKFTIEHVTAEFRGNLYNRSLYTGIKADMLDIYNYNGAEEVISCTATDNEGETREIPLYDKSAIDKNDMYKLYLGDDSPLVTIKTQVNNDKKLLVIKDDFADCFIPFLTHHYSEIAVVSPDCMTVSLNELINRDDYAQTLIMFGIDSLSEGVNQQSVR